MNRKISCLFGIPDRESTRNAIARCIGLIQRRHAVSLAEIAHAAGCDASTIENANKAETTLSAEFFARLKFYFDAECFEPWERHCRPEACEQRTIRDRLESIEREAAAIRKELAA